MTSLPNLFRRLWHQLSRQRRFQFALVMCLMLLSALAEIVSLGSILPFLGILVNPDRVFSHPLIADFVRPWGFTSADQLVLPLTIMFAAAALTAGLVRILVLWASTMLAYATGADLAAEAYRRTLYQPYQIHIARNSSEVISAISNKVDGAVYVLHLLMILISSFALLITIAIALMAIHPQIALLATLGFGTSYGLITWLSRHQVHRNSHVIAYEQTQVIKALQEGLGGIRDVLLDGTQPIYSDIYRRANYPLRRAQGINAFIAGAPRYAMEAFGMVLIAALAYSLSVQSGGLTEALPVLGALALGAQRLIPALQLSYSAWTGIGGNQAALADTIELLEQPIPAEVLKPAHHPLPLAEAITLNAIRFRYIGDGPWILDGLNLTIPKGARVGFVGHTGGGKSTTLDLIMGLLKPTEGSLLVDGQPVSGNRLKAWQKAIAHVPQSIYLTDASLAENIAFGIPREAIDMQRVRQAAVQAQIAEFIESRSDGYDAYVGERGIRLSGGQRQRIGIARALYKQASVLIFDEATSALDNATELSVMDAIEKLNRNLTILIIAHRLTTVRRCDKIIELINGRIAAQGTYDELLEKSRTFRDMALAV